jgi:sialate O-acetylesterase
MQFTVDSAFNATAEVAAADGFPYIRLFTAALYASNTPLVQLESVEEPWSVASSASVGGGNWTYFSAVWLGSGGG